MQSSDFSHPSENRYFEDYVPGLVQEFGSVTVDEDEVLEFGKRYVPLPYHIDKEAAKSSIYAGVIASGWHTAALMMRLLHRELFVPGRQSRLTRRRRIALGQARLSRG